LVLAVGLAAPGPKDAPKKADPPAIAGEWECVQCIAGGQMFPAEEVKQISFEFTGDGKFRGRFGPQEIPDGTYTTDLAKDPAEIDYGTPTIAKKNHGIYKFDKDMFILCAAEGGGDRPKTFDSPAGSGIMLLTFRRVEKKKE
jgi:uncharacterized protein (TIGR03067 family)